MKNEQECLVHNFEYVRTEKVIREVVGKDITFEVEVVVCSKCGKVRRNRKEQLKNF